MSILTNPVFIVILFVSLVSSYTDIRFRKIYNSLTLPVIIGGILYSGFTLGFQGFLFSLLSVVLAFLLFGWMYFTKQVGAGDVKLLMAFGAWGGVLFTFHTAILSILIGGIFGVIILIKEKKLLKFINKLKIFFYGMVYKEISTGFPEIDKKLTFPFGLAISLAALSEFLLQPINILRGAL